MHILKISFSMSLLSAYSSVSNKIKGTKQSQYCAIANNLCAATVDINN